MSGPKIITSSRWGKKLLFNGNIYYRRDSRKGQIYRNCVRKETAFTHQIGNEIRVTKEATHTHTPPIKKQFKLKECLKWAVVDQPPATAAQILRVELN